MESDKLSNRWMGALALLSVLLLSGCLGAAPEKAQVSQNADGNQAITTPLPSTNQTTPGPNYSAPQPLPNDSLAPPNPPQDRFDRMIEEVYPAEGVELNATWGDLGPKTAGSGALDITKLTTLMARNGQPLTGEQLGVLQNGSGGRIRIDRNNSYFILNLLWAFGLVNKNPVLDNGAISSNPSTVGEYASTGGWPLGDSSGGALLSSKPLITLDQRQQTLVEKVASSTYRPCCDNPTSFPDCNHGMAALGLIEWMAYQNASEDSIYRAVLTVNSYWFPQTYVDIDEYLSERNQSWSGADPRQLLSYNYSSYSGYQSVIRSLKDAPPTVNSGGRCGA